MRSPGVGFYVPCHLLAVIANCYRGHFVTEGNLSHGASCKEEQIVFSMGHVVLEGYRPKLLFD